jgi:hypothetical protein
MTTLFVMTGAAAGILLTGFVLHEVRDATRPARRRPVNRPDRRWRYEATVAK